MMAMSLRARILLLFAIATLLVAASVAVPAWLVLRDGEQRSAVLRAMVQASAVRDAMEMATAPLAEALRGIARDEALATARAAGDEQALRQRLGALRDETSVTRLDLLGGQGQWLAAAPAADEPLISGSAALVREITADSLRVGFEASAAEGVVLVVSLGLTPTGVLSASLGGEVALHRIAQAMGAAVLLRDRAGVPLAASASWLLSEAGGTVTRGGRIYRTESMPLLNSAGAAIGEIQVMAEVTAEAQARQLVLLLAGALLVIAASATCLALYRIIRDALDPLTELARALQAVARGDIFASAAIGTRGDEVGAIGQALEALRANTLTLDRLEARARLAGHRERAVIGREIARLAEVLEGRERSEILGLLGAEGATLAPAFARLSGHVAQQHRAMATLLAERTRDLDLVREALEERTQLSRMREELDVARRLQLSSVPTVFPQSADFRLHATMLPAKEVGGDFCDVFMLDDHRLALMIGDASGKGVGAAIFIAMARSLLRAAIGRGASPAEALAQANDTLAADNPTLMFATAIVAVLDCTTGVLTYANAGHNAPRLRAADGREGELTLPDGIALGVMDGFAFEDRRHRLIPGDHVLFFTDGVTEAIGPGQVLFGDARLAAVMREAARAPAPLLDAVQRAVERFAASEPQADDITMLALSWRGEDQGADASQQEALAWT